MTERTLIKCLALLLTLCLAIPLPALADREDAAQMAAYWDIVGQGAADSPLARAMNDDYATLSNAEQAAALDALKAVTADELLAFAAEYRLPVSMARHAWYAALALCLEAHIAQNGASPVEQTLALFLAMPENARDKAANQERRDIRKGLTEQDVLDYAGQTGLPAGFLCWLLLDDEWHEDDWEDGDDWREGRRGWNIPDWVDAADLRERYGKDAVVTDDGVERTLRQNGIYIDD